MGEVSALTFSDIERLAEAAARSGVFGGASKDECIIRIVKGIEMGLPPGAALTAWHNLKGQLVLKSDMHLAVCLKQPVCAAFDLVELTDTSCTYRAQRVGGEPQTFTFTVEDAKRAGLLNNATWQKHPKAMLRARCGAITARAVFPDVVGGLYDEGEGEEIAASKSSRYKPSAPAQTGNLLPAPAPEPVVLEGTHEPPGALTPDQALSAIAACQTLADLDTLNVAVRAVIGSWQTHERNTVRLARDARVGELTAAGAT